ncbi:MAG: hypothetical protein II062_02000 [Oscillospiraceae bacterium]|nr:hypothetical protein [Oscillospiraceae bacterium]
MRFPNAYKGVKNIYTSEILNLISAVLSGLLVIAAAVDKQRSLTGFVLVIALFAGLGSIAALILQLVGILQAAKDETSFEKARVSIITALVLSFLSAVYGDDPAVIAVPLKLAASIASLCCGLFIIKGIMNLSRRLHQVDMTDRGRRLYHFILIVACSGIVLELISAILPRTYGSGIFVLILLLAALGLAVTEIVMLFRYYSRTLTMLQQADAQAPIFEEQFPNL